MRIEGFFGGPQAGQGKPLVPGKLYSFRVASTEGKSAFLVFSNGTRMKAVVGGRLSVGQTYRARVVVRANRTFLELNTNPPAPAASGAAAQLGVHESAASSATIRAFITAGLPLDRTAVERVLRRVEKEDKRSSLAERARLGALLEARGLTDEASWIALMDVMGYSTPDRGYEDRRDALDDQDKSLESQIAGAVRFSSEGDHPLQLFNHIKESGDHWLIIPFLIKGVSSLKGTIRLRMPARASGVFASQLDFQDAIVDIRTDADRQTFRIVPTNEGWSLSQVVGSRLDTAVAARLERVLTKLDVEFSSGTTTGDDGEFDGFSWLVEPDILRGIDNQV